jgi:uncharacterized protein involved in exopolysaccharide biosynthesis
VDSTARIIRARATADAVVTRLGLDKDPHFNRQSRLSSLLWEIRWRLGLQKVPPTPHELAVNAVMHQVRVTNDPRSYLISISANAGTPSEAARLANAVGSEYLRSQALQQVADARAAAERELSSVALTYGFQHPIYLRARARLEELQARLRAMRERKEEAGSVPFGESMIPAREVLTPAGPNVTMTLGFAVVMALGGGIWLVRRSTRLARSGVSGDSVPGR